MELAVYNIKGEDTGRKVTLNDEVFGIDVNEHAPIEPGARRRLCWPWVL